MKNGFNLLTKLKEKRETFITIGIFILFFLISEFVINKYSISSLLFPLPSKVISNFVTGFIEGFYTEHLLITLSRLVMGFVIGGGSGLIFGLILGWSEVLRKIVDPVISAIHPIPKFALLPLVIIAFGIGESSRIIMVSIAAFFPMLINTIGGVLEINPIHYQVLRNYGGNNLDIFKKVVFPGSLPFVMTGARLSLKSSLTISVAIEMLFGNTGLGTLIYKGWNSLNLLNVYSILIIISIIGVCSNFLLGKAKEKFVPWHED